MWLSSILNSLIPSSPPTRTRRRPSPRQRPAARRLTLEALEDRCLLAFLAPVSYDAGAYPSGMVTADFNNDTVLDVAVANDSSVSVLLGNADGTFQPALTSATSAYPSSLAVGDFNADGKLDLATSNGSDASVSVLLGNGNGAFQAPSSIYLNSYPASVSVGDFNGDGKLDLAVLSSYGGDYYYTSANSYATVLLGNGDGSFSEPRTTDLGYGNPTSAAVADFNGDGKLDFATANYEFATVSVLLGDGLGNLRPPTSFSTGSSVPRSVVAGDVNGDGKLDLVTANGVNHTVSVLLGDGLGSFGSARIYATGYYTSSVALGDFNRDGEVDLIFTPWDGGVSNVSVLFGIGGGAFSPPRNVAVGSYLGAGDFNSDGWLDAATVSGNGVSVLINDTVWPPVDAPSITISDMSVTEGNTGTVNATFTVSLSAAYGQPVTVSFATADGTATAGSDYQAKAGILAFAPGETSKTITVLVSGDRLGEPSESFFVNVSTANAFIGDGRSVGTILDDEPRISINGLNVTEGNTGTVSATFTVSLSAACEQPVTVHYATADATATAGSDYTAVSGDVTFNPGQITRTITVAVLGDRVPEANEYIAQEYFIVNLSGPSSNSVIANSQGGGVILDDEPRIRISDVSKKEGKKGQTTLFTFTVTLSAAYDQPVTMSFRTVDGTATTSDSDYVAKTGTLTFNPGQTTKTITIEVKGDSKKEAGQYFFETFYLDLFGNSSNSLFTKKRGIGTILNDD